KYMIKKKSKNIHNIIIKTKNNKRKGRAIIRNNLIPVYREKEFYTLFYDQHQNVIYKLQHRNKSFGLFFMFIIAMTWFSESLDAFYINYKNTFLNIVTFIFAIGITY